MASEAHALALETAGLADLSSKNQCGRERRLRLSLKIEPTKSIELMPRVSKNHLKACTRVKLQAGGAPVFISLERLLRAQRARRRGIEDAGFAGAQLLENQSALPPVHDYDVVRWSHELQAPVASEHVQRAGRRRASLVLHGRRHLSFSSVPSLRSPRTSRSTSHASDMLRPDAAQQHRGGHPSSRSRRNLRNQHRFAT